MSEPIAFDVCGFLNGTWPLNHSNWAAYFEPSIPDGVVANSGGEMEVYASSSGMYVYVRTGECRVHTHHAQINEIKALAIDAADATYGRIDLVVARVKYAAAEMELAVKTGTPASSPTVPEVTQTAGDVWEIPLAEVSVGAGVSTIAAGNVTDLRSLYQMEVTRFRNFSGTTLTAEDHTEYRGTASLASLRIDLPDTPDRLFCISLSFTSAASFSGITFRKGSSAYTPKRVGDLLTYAGKRYNLSVWWDGSYYWVSAKAA